MSYTVLARRYRSQAFADVIGQEPVAKTLRNAIATGRVAHAYLFTGTRGVGKTSMARLFARALNAPATVSDCPKPGTESPDHAAAERNPGGEATGIRPDYQYPDEDVQHRMAEAIMRGDDLNVIEIDGASHNKVEDARDLISNAGLSPTTHARFKIYIIDEVHMLSTAAFNALLKTMEEPPPHVKFILATTEPQKVPPTIQSRCQRFDFRNIPSGRIADHLRAVLEKEGVEADDEVVFQLAALGNGSMRDALSLLDRLIATGDRPLTTKTLEEMFGLPDAELIHRLIAAFADADVPAALNQAGDLLARGISQDQLVEVLIDHLRTLMLLSACGSDTPLVEIAPQGREKAAELAHRFDTPAIVHMIALCENLQRSARASANGRALLDATLARLCLTENIADVAALLAGNASPAPQKKKVSDPPARPLQRPGSAPATQARPPHAAKKSVPPHAAAERSEAAGIAFSSDPPTERDPGSEPPAITDLWQRLLANTKASGAFAWLQHVRPLRIEGDEVIIAPVPGRAEVVRFATADKLDKVARECSDIAGRRMRVRFDADTTAGNATGATGSPSQGGPPPASRRAAMELPLVREAFEVFPDAMLIDVRSEPTD